MPVYQGTIWSQAFTLQSDGVPLDLTGWTFRAHIRDHIDDDTELLELTSAGGGFEVTDAANGQFSMRLTAAQTATLPTGMMVFDVIRTDVALSPQYLFGGRFKVKKPVTRDA